MAKENVWSAEDQKHQKNGEQKGAKMGKEKLLQSRRLEIEGSEKGPCGPKNLTFTFQGIQFETVTKGKIIYLLRPNMDVASNEFMANISRNIK